MARYVVIEIYPEDLLDRVLELLREKFQSLLGIRVIKGSLVLIEKVGNRAVLRVTTRLLPYLRASTVLIREVDGRPVLVLTVRVTGTARKAKAQARSIPKLAPST